MCVTRHKYVLCVINSAFKNGLVFLRRAYFVGRIAAIKTANKLIACHCFVFKTKKLQKYVTLNGKLINYTNFFCFYNASLNEMTTANLWSFIFETIKKKRFDLYMKSTLFVAFLIITTTYMNIIIFIKIFLLKHT